MYISYIVPYSVLYCMCTCPVLYPILCCIACVHILRILYPSLCCIACVHILYCTLFCAVLHVYISYIEPYSVLYCMCAYPILYPYSVLYCMCTYPILYPSLCCIACVHILRILYPSLCCIAYVHILYCTLFCAVLHVYISYIVPYSVLCRRFRRKWRTVSLTWMR